MDKCKRNVGAGPVSAQKGITLIVLVITIIILLILAGITINLVLAEGGLVERAGAAVQEHKKAAAREELELKLAVMQAEKLVNNRDYTEGSKDYEYLSDELWKEGYIVNEDIVTVDGWQFVIDRSVPKIESYLGKGEKDDSIKIEYSEITEKPYTFSTITVKITSQQEKLQSIMFNGKNILELIDTDENYSVDAEGNYVIKVTENKTYNIYVQNTSEKYNSAKIPVTKITEDMEIWTKSDLVQFRNNVNEGRTYEGRTVKVMADIDLNEGKYTVADDGIVTFADDAEQWVPIANYASDTNLIFKGTFDGNNKTISNLYINTINAYQGLFGYNSGTIENLILENANITSSSNTIGILVGYNNNGNINGVKTNGYICGSYYVGGIVGFNTSGDIVNSCNLAEIIATYTTTGACCGGIVGYGDSGGLISKCYNNGKITCKGYIVGGIAGFWRGSSIIEFSYNTGNITAGRKSDGYSQIGGIVGSSLGGVNISYTYNTGEIVATGSNGYGLLIGEQSGSTTSLNYSYSAPYNNRPLIGKRTAGTWSEVEIVQDMLEWDNEKITTKLTNNFVKDEKNINGGYPILKWQLGK